MKSGGFGATRQNVVRLFEGTSVAGLADGELLERFASSRDESAFESLVDRLGPMVLGVCRRMLTDSHDVDDAFQATFLILVRKAGSIRDPGLVAPWLHGVATKVARRARAEASRGKARERLAVVVVEAAHDTVSHLEWSELRSRIDEEIERLPDHQRSAVVLCDVEGLTREEAAQRLGWSLNMVRGRLERARDRLRGRLTRQGLAPSGTWAVLAVAPPMPSPSLLVATIRAGLAFSVGRVGSGLVSASVVGLSQGVLRMMMLSKLKVSLAVLVSTGFVVAGSGMMIAAQVPATGTTTKPAPASPKPTLVVVEAPAIQDPAQPPVVPMVVSDPFKPRSAADLAKARIDAARERYKAQHTFFEEGRITIDRLSNASKALMEAERDANRSKASRVEAIRAHYTRLVTILRNEEAMLELGRTTKADVSEIKTAILDTEFALAGAMETPETKPTDVGPQTRPGEPRSDAQLLGDYQRSVRTARNQLDFELWQQVEADRKAGKTEAEALAIHKERLAKLQISINAALPAPARASETKPADRPGVARRNIDQERVEIARRLADEAQRLFQNAMIGTDEALDAWNILAEAEYRVARTKAGRTAALQSRVINLEKVLMITEARVEAARSKATEVDKVRLRLLDAEALLIEESSKPEEPGEAVAPKPD